MADQPQVVDQAQTSGGPQFWAGGTYWVVDQFGIGHWVDIPGFYFPLTSLNVARLPNSIEGDEILLFVQYSGGGTVVCPGFEEIIHSEGLVAGVSIGGQDSWAVLKKVHGPLVNESGSYTASFTVAQNTICYMVAFAVRGQGDIDTAQSSTSSPSTTVSSGPFTTTTNNALVFNAYSAPYDGSQIAVDGLQTRRASFPYALIATSVQLSAGPTERIATIPTAQATHTVTVVVAPAQTPPLGAVITSPATNTPVDFETQDVPITWEHIDQQGSVDPQTAVRIRATLEDLSEHWFDGTDFDAVVETDWVTGVDTLVIPAGTFTNQAIIFDVATRDTRGPDWGDYGPPVMLLGSDAPTLDIVGPAEIVIDTTSPTLQWESTNQAGVEAKVWSAAQYVVANFAPETATATFVLPRTPSLLKAWPLSVQLDNGGQYVEGVRVFNELGLSSGWKYRVFRIGVPPAVRPAATWLDEPTAGALNLTAIGLDNRADAAQGQQEGDVIPWESVDNAALSLELVDTPPGVSRGVKVAAVTAGDVEIQTTDLIQLGTEESVTMMIEVKHQEQPRNFRFVTDVYNASGELLESITSETFQTGNNVEGPPPVDPEPVYTVRVSSSASRSPASTAIDAAVAGKVAWFIDPLSPAVDTDDIASVKWWLAENELAALDLMDGAPTFTDIEAPFDFAGTGADGSANMYDTATNLAGTTDAPGNYGMAVLITRLNGTTQTISFGFTVENIPAPVSTDLTSNAEAISDMLGPPLRTDGVKSSGSWGAWGANDGLLTGVPPDYDYAGGARSAYGAIHPFTNIWGQVFYEPVNTVFNGVRLQDREWWVWVYIDGPGWVRRYRGITIAGNGGYWDGEFGGGVTGVGLIRNFNQYGGVRIEPASRGGGSSISLQGLNGSDISPRPDCVHHWPDFGQYFYNGDALAVHVSVQQRLIADTPAVRAQLANARYVGIVSADMFPRQITATDNPPHSGDIGEARHKRLGYEGQNALDGWKSFTNTALTPRAGFVPHSPSMTLAQKTTINNSNAALLRAFIEAHPVPLQAV